MLSHLNKSLVKHHTLPVNSKYFFNFPFLANKIDKIIKDNSINILHVRSRGPAWLFPFINKKNIKTVSTFHNVYGHQNFIKIIYNKQLAKVDVIVAISDYVKSEIIKIYNIDPKKIIVINRGIDTDFFNLVDHSKTANFFLNQKQIDIEKRIILYPGRITEWKGQIKFLNIVEHFKNSPIIFYFSGDTKNLSFYNKFVKEINKKKLNNNIRILGNLNKEELRLMYQYSDLVISAPLRAEGFGRTISECLSMQKLVLAFDYGGAKNQLEKLDSIYKVKPFDYNEMKTKISIMLELDTNIILKMGNINRKHVIHFFSKEKMLSAYEKIYEEILS